MEKEKIIGSHISVGNELISIFEEEDEYYKIDYFSHIAAAFFEENGITKDGIYILKADKKPLVMNLVACMQKSQIVTLGAYRNKENEDAILGALEVLGIKNEGKNENTIVIEKDDCKIMAAAVKDTNCCCHERFNFIFSCLGNKEMFEDSLKQEFYKLYSQLIKTNI